MFIFVGFSRLLVTAHANGKDSASCKPALSGPTVPLVPLPCGWVPTRMPQSPLPGHQRPLCRGVGAEPPRRATTHLRATRVRVSLLILSLVTLSWAADGGRAQRRRRARCRAATICGDNSAVSRGPRIRAGGPAVRTVHAAWAGGTATLCGSHTAGGRAAGRWGGRSLPVLGTMSLHRGRYLAPTDYRHGLGAQDA